MSKIIYEHTNGHQTVVELDPQVTMEGALGMASLQEVWKILEAEIRADAVHTEHTA